MNIKELYELAMLEAKECPLNKRSHCYDSPEQEQLAKNVFLKHRDVLKRLADGRLHVFNTNHFGDYLKTEYKANGLFPERAYQEIINLLKKGKEKYPDDKWKTLGIDEHIDKALSHIQSYDSRRDPDSDSPSHLINACVRLIFAIELLLNKELDGS